MFHTFIITHSKIADNSSLCSRFSNVSPHPAFFTRNLPFSERQEALQEFYLIKASNALNPLAAWYRQTNFNEVKRELERYFIEVTSGCRN